MASAREQRVRTVNAVVASVTTALACSVPNERPFLADNVEPTTTLRDEQQRTRLAAPCESRGIETCFDAIDDNCNGLVDEGCGLPNGPFQVVIAWEPPDADVDLDVFDPSGEPSLVGRPTSLGLVKDRDCPKEPNECGGQNVEVVYVGGDDVPTGRYLVTLRLQRRGSSAKDVSVRLGGHIGNVTLRGQYVLTSASPETHFELDRRDAKPRTSGSREK